MKKAILSLTIIFSSLTSFAQANQYSKYICYEEIQGIVGRPKIVDMSKVGQDTGIPVHLSSANNRWGARVVLVPLTMEDENGQVIQGALLQEFNGSNYLLQSSPGADSISLKAQDGVTVSCVKSGRRA